MTERCGNCGAELFEGQQFCRACGTPTRQFSGEDLPTQMLPHQQQPQHQQSPPQQQQPPNTPLSTAPLSGGRNTSDPVYGTGYPSYQPHAGVPQQHHTSPVAFAPPTASPRRRSRGWLYAVVALLIFFGGASLMAGLFFANRSQRAVRVSRPKVVVPPVPDVMPPMPPPFEGDEDALLENEGAEVSGNQTTITKTYPLAKNGAFALHNINGDITVEGWDEQQAEVTIIKRGGSPQARDALKIMREQSADRLAFSTMPEGRAGGVEEVRYEVKLPRNLRELQIVSNNSNVELTGANAASISIMLQRGNIGLEDVSGTVNSRTTKGNTKVVIGDAARTAPQVFNGISGNIELELSPDVNAELKAETISGDIEVDEDLGLKVEKRMIGQQAVGRIGKGGQPIVVKTVSGNIKIKS
jgi:hypothetical protein